MKSYLNVNTFLWEVFKFYEYHKYRIWDFGLIVPCIRAVAMNFREVRPQRLCDLKLGKTEVLQLLPVMQGCSPRGCRGYQAPPPDFGRSVNLISTRRADCARKIILAPADFQTFLRPCNGGPSIIMMWSEYHSHVWFCPFGSKLFKVIEVFVKGG